MLTSESLTAHDRDKATYILNFTNCYDNLAEMQLPIRMHNFEYKICGVDVFSC